MGFPGNRRGRGPCTDFSFELSGIHPGSGDRPLYAILLGVWVRDTSIDRPNTPAALVRHLVDKWLERPESDSGLRDCIRSLARLSVEAGDMESGGTGRGRPALRAVLLKLG
jgi:hypothetical protein